MNAVLEERIIERLHNLDEPKLAEVLDFVELLARRQQVAASQSQPVFQPTTLTEVAGMFRGRVTPKTDEEIEAALLQDIRERWREGD